ncbi:alpha/beta hydrolase [Actinomadura sp. DC4]|uniref:alpha/beta hydrolase n=1 Tax=Actinomadura sp. DC4 TaxID=3055069 RepID=UPI0025B216A5|nr:alpha/beta hydrolase [Actinomadura sp. DC4]MDN3353950.1 alpha/beta hydrolase [Actinomadura sp. DC4]
MTTAVRLGVRPFAGRIKGRSATIRFWRSLLGAGSRCLRPDPRVSVEPIIDPCVEDPGVKRAVRGEWLRSPGRSTGQGAILYLHGGGYAICSPRTHRVITARLAMDTGLPVLVPDYRLAPEHPFPAAFEDCLDAYRLLLARGVPAEHIIVAGDSSGGHLATALTAEACRTGLPSPGGVVLFSPWVDLTGELAMASEMRRHDPYIDPAVATRFGRLYVGAGDWTDPRLSLLTCPSEELPPFLIQVGGIEVLRAEAEALAEVLDEAGSPFDLQIWPGQMHVFQIFNRMLPEADEAMREAGRFIREVVGVDSVTEAA